MIPFFRLAAALFGRDPIPDLTPYQPSFGADGAPRRVKTPPLSFVLRGLSLLPATRSFSPPAFSVFSICTDSAGVLSLGRFSFPRGLFWTVFHFLSVFLLIQHKS